MTHVRWVRYVRFADIGAYLDLGWHFDCREPPLHMPHGAFAVILEWLCSCRDPVEPLR